MKVRMYSDGGARGNPGPAGAAAVIMTSENEQEGSVIKEVSNYVGETTNNQAEYYGLIIGLQAALDMGVTEIDVRMDSELIVRQILGQYRVKQPDLAKRFLEAKQLCNQFSRICFSHVPRAKNAHADRLVNEVIDAYLAGLRQPT